MMIMEDSKMSKIEYGLKAIMYSAYDTPHKLCNISGNSTIQQPRLPTNNNTHASDQMPPRLEQVESRPRRRDLALC